MNLLTESAFLKALGWSLLDSLWQTGILYLVYILLTANGKKFSARQRHAIALLSLAGGSVWFLVSLIMHFYEELNTPAIVGAASLPGSGWLNRIALQMEPALPVLSAAYLAAAAFLFVRFYYQYRHTQNLFSSGLHKAHPGLRVFLRRMAGQMSIKKEVKIWFSELVDTPLTLGFLKPVILLPVAAMNHLTLQQTEAILLHELNHIRQHDYLINLLITCTEIIFFFNPFSRLFTDIIKRERENSCDDMVLQFRYDAHSYAAALLALEKNRTSAPALAVAATGKNRQLLLNRVKRILQEPVASTLNYRLIAYLFLALLVAWIGWSNPGRAIVKTISAVKDMLPATAPTEPPVIYTVSYTPAGSPAKAKQKKHTTSKAGNIASATSQAAWKLFPAVAAQDDEQITVEQHDEESNDENNDIATFANTTEAWDFTLPETQSAVAAIIASGAYPYVPSTSLNYQFTEDTTLPKSYTPSYNELKARESMEKALKAMNEIDWQKLQKEIAATGKNIDLNKLQAELKKALAQVDWNKINEQVESVEQVQGELLCDQEALHRKMKNYQNARRASQDRVRRLQQVIVDQRLSEIPAPKDMEEDRKQAETQKVKLKKKKIVTI